MSNITEKTLSEAFFEKLKGLCLNQFPCGNGKWRSGNMWRCDSPDLLNQSKEPDANQESTQTLLEISKLEPFIMEENWSEDIPCLRKLAIENPEKLNENNIHLHFKQLRLVGVNISKIDGEILKFKNLKELTLSANIIESINSRNLPKGLELLELYGNQLYDIEPLTVSLPSLLHLGVGNNSLLTIIDAIKPNTWNNMLSLDLSSNSLTRLKETLETLKNLPNLNNLLLQGNPLFLSAGYRGLVVDTLKQLTILDDVRITADEKHRFKGTSKLRGLNANNAVVEIHFKELKGIKSSQEAENDSGEEYPKTEYRYQICYPFLVESTIKKPIKKTECTKENEKDTSELGPEGEERQSASETEDEVIIMGTSSASDADCLLKRKTKEKQWCEEEINMCHERIFLTSDLINLKNFMADGITLELIENKVLVSLEPPVEENFSVAGDIEADKHSKVSKSKGPPKEKPKPPPTQVAAPTKANLGKSKKRNKGEELPLYELSRESKMIASTSLSMDDFIIGVKSIEKQCLLSMVEIGRSRNDTFRDSKDAKIFKKPSSGVGKRITKENNKYSESATSNKHAKAEKGEKNPKAKESKHLKNEVIEIDEPEPPCQITIDVKICLHSWKTGREAQDWINNTHYRN